MREVEGEGVVSERVANDSSSVSTLEKNTLNIYHVLEELNEGILRLCEDFERKFAKKKSTHRLSEEFVASKDTIHHQFIRHL